MENKNVRLFVEFTECDENNACAYLTRNKNNLYNAVQEYLKDEAKKKSNSEMGPTIYATMLDPTKQKTAEQVKHDFFKWGALSVSILDGQEANLVRIKFKDVDAAETAFEHCTEPIMRDYVEIITMDWNKVIDECFNTMIVNQEQGKFSSEIIEMPEMSILRDKILRQMLHKDIRRTHVFLVTDTNCFIEESSMKLLNVMSCMSHVTFVIPQMVLLELDKLKNHKDKKIFLNARKWHRTIADKSPKVYVQKDEHKMPLTPEEQVQLQIEFKADVLIGNCALYYTKYPQAIKVNVPQAQREVMLMTNDNWLRAYAHNRGVNSFTCQEVYDLLNKKK